MDDRIKLAVLHKETFSAEKSEKRLRDSWEGEEERKTKSTKPRGCYLAKQPEMGLITGGIKQPSGC